MAQSKNYQGSDQLDGWFSVALPSISPAIMSDLASICINGGGEREGD